MALYEHIFMVRQDVSSSQVDALTQQFKSILEEHGGSVGKTEYWGVRSLAYRVKKNRKAHYTLMNIDAPSAAVKEMERQMAINDDVIRVLTLRVDEHDDDQSAMMRTGRGRDRDDRGPRDRDQRPRRDDSRPTAEKEKPAEKPAEKAADKDAGDEKSEEDK